jgi:hypothetical protein
MSDKKVISIDSELYIVESSDSTERTTAELVVPDPESPSVFAKQLKASRPLNNNTKKAPHES